MKEEEIEEIFKPKKISVVVLLIYLIIGIGCIGIIFYVRYEKTNESLNLAEQILNNAEKEEQYVSIDIAYLPQLIATNPEKENCLYFITDEENHLYIAKLSNKTLDYLKSICDEETGKLNDIYHLEGLTYNIDSQTQALSLRTSDKLFPEKELTLDNFSQQLGTVYVYENKIIANDNVITLLKISALTGVFFLILAFLYILPFILNEKKVLKNKDLVEDLKSELRSLNHDSYGMIKLYLTKNYIFSICYGKNIIKYEDIIWCYISDVGYETTLIVYTKDKKKHTIAEVEAGDNTLEEVLSDIQEKNANMRVGYNQGFFIDCNNCVTKSSK